MNELTRIEQGALQEQAAVSELDDSPTKERRWGWAVIIAFFVIFLGWAAIVRMDAAAYASGVVAVSGNRQVVQHRQGGTVSAIHVREGQRVTAGQVLVELTSGDTGAAAGSLSAQAIGLRARRARLNAERLGLQNFAVPPDLQGVTGPAAAEVRTAMLLERAELAARQRTRIDQQRVLGQQLAQLEERSQGIEQQIIANREQSRLLQEELRGLQTIAERGFASLNRIRALQRAAAQLSGDLANLQATVAAVREQMGENRMQALTLTSEANQRISEELRTVEASLSELLPRERAAVQELANTLVRAPATGRLVGLQVFTVGGVITPGQTLMEIVPDRAQLVIQARVSPDDGDDLYVGQETELSISALREQRLPILTGRITRVSADTFQDERTGERYYTAEVVVTDQGREQIERFAGADALVAGMPVEIIIPLRRRTFLEYLFEPLNHSFWRSFREQ